SIITELLDLMQRYRADFTNTFRLLTLNQGDKTDLSGVPEFSKWLDQWKDRRTRQQVSFEASEQLMKRNHPAVIARNHRVEEALEAAVEHNDFTVMNNLLDVLADPYAHSAQQEAYTTVPTLSNRP